ncbi:MAG: DNA repair protein RadA [candidate division Zixibacteria bacterium]|nr:DNA repair protein RadA [candidate division Zixibacteria bacterium]
MKTAPKKKTAFFRTNCGSQHPRWQGQCRECGAWNTLHEEAVVAPSPARRHQTRTVEARRIPEISVENCRRISSGMEEFDRVLGGGAVPGSALLVGGEPGIGKSSLLLQVADVYGRRGYRSLYLSGEESMEQIKARADRFGIAGDAVSVANITDLDEIVTLAQDDFQFIIIDSIQTVASAAFDSPPGTVGQVRESSSRLIELVKQTGRILFLVGHITKDGLVAGPKVLEHMVDTVLYFEGDRYHLFRILRSQKNRFGPTGEIGVFEMTGGGLIEIKNPSQIFMTSTGSEPSPGRVISAASEGSRSFLVEVEALVTTSPYGTPQRVASGIDGKRLAIISAVLEKRGGVMLGGNDIFVNIAGGIQLDDTALDLAFLTAAASSKLNIAVDGGMMVVGEVGLSGDIRGVAQIDRRLAEAAKLGLKRAMIPKTNASGLTVPSGIEIIPVSTVNQALQVIR